MISYLQCMPVCVCSSLKVMYIMFPAPSTASNKTEPDKLGSFPKSDLQPKPANSGVHVSYPPLWQGLSFKYTITSRRHRK